MPSIGQVMPAHNCVRHIVRSGNLHSGNRTWDRTEPVAKSASPLA